MVPQSAAGDGPIQQSRVVTELRRPTARQVEAVYAVMRLLRRDPSVAASGSIFVCGGCGRAREQSGSVAYGPLTLCSGCATDYELLRLAASTRAATDEGSAGTGVQNIVECVAQQIEREKQQDGDSP